jgi:hypothetical protein
MLLARMVVVTDQSVLGRAGGSAKWHALLLAAGASPHTHIRLLGVAVGRTPLQAATAVTRTL